MAMSDSTPRASFAPELAGANDDLLDSAVFNYLLPTTPSTWASQTWRLEDLNVALPLRDATVSTFSLDVLPKAAEIPSTIARNDGVTFSQPLSSIAWGTA